MSKKPQKKGGGKAVPPDRSVPREDEKPKGLRYFPLVIGLVVVLGLGAAYFFSRSGSQQAPQASQAVGSYAMPIGGETRPLLDPDHFSGKVRQAYQVAREIPQVLDQIYCYCACQESHGHKSLLSCYTDLHAVG